jgi:phosphatidate cytidylyltransferase
MRPANFLTRTLTAIIFAVLMIGSILAGPLYFAVVMLFVLVLGLLEFSRLTVPGGSSAAKFTGILTGLLIFLLVFFSNYGWVNAKWLWAIPVLFLLPLVNSMFDKRSQSISIAAFQIAGLVFIAVPLSLFTSLILFGSGFENIAGKEFLLSFLVILWVYDTGAYLIGSWLGKHKLNEKVSPGKTWEGSIGGFIPGIAAAWAISVYLNEIALIHWLAIAVIIMVFGTLGDLCESLLKRNAGVKDSGKILPGHGGILDRFDAVLMSAPVVFFYIIVFLT